MALVLDTGAIIALLDRDAAEHARTVAMVDGIGEDLVVPGSVLAEVDYWVRKHLDPLAWRTFVSDIVEGAYRLESLTVEDLERAAAIHAEYAELDLGFVDASVIATCERLGETKVATLDRRGFSVVRPRHCDYLRLLPD